MQINNAPNKFKIEDLIYYHTLGMNDKVISEKLSVSRDTIVKHRNRINLKPNKGVWYEKVKLNFEEEQVLIGGLLGDCHLVIGKNSNHASGMFAHSLSQSDYVDYKYSFLKRFCREPFNTNRIDKRNSKEYSRRDCIIYTNPVFDIYYNCFYQNKVQ